LAGIVHGLKKGDTADGFWLLLALTTTILSGLNRKGSRPQKGANGAKPEFFRFGAGSCDLCAFLRLNHPFFTAESVGGVGAAFLCHIVFFVANGMESSRAKRL
jgi:hypothetical protein